MLGFEEKLHLVAVMNCWIANGIFLLMSIVFQQNDFFFAKKAGHIFVKCD